MNKENNLFNKIAFHIGKAVIVATIYYLGFLIGEFFKLQESSISFFWPQSGFALAIILLLGTNNLPGVFLGSLIGEVVSGIFLPHAIINSIGNVLAVFFSSYFILHQNNFSKHLNNYQSVLSLIIFGVIIGPFISATINVIGIYLLNLNSLDILPIIWGMHWILPALGILVFTPILIVWLGNPIPKFDVRKVIEGSIVFLCIMGLGLLLFVSNIPNEAIYPISFLIIPLIIWSSIRNSIHGSLLINLCATLLFLWGVTHNQSQIFISEPSTLITYMSVIATMLMTSLIISASMANLSATQQSLSYLSTHDSLTGLYNRLFFETEFKRLENSRQFPISIIMADIDKLKFVNDNFGHRTGDQALINVANLFTDVFRQEDIISRIGGDEFVILLPNTNTQIAKNILKRIKKQINVYNRKHVDLPIKLSMGVSTAKEGESLQSHFKIADQHMYDEKQKRNQK